MSSHRHMCQGVTYNIHFVRKVSKVNVTVQAMVRGCGLSYCMMSSPWNNCTQPLCYFIDICSFFFFRILQEFILHESSYKQYQSGFFVVCLFPKITKNLIFKEFSMWWGCSCRDECKIKKAEICKIELRLVWDGASARKRPTWLGSLL